jgi:ATP phosphoribosyltransferase
MNVPTAKLEEVVACLPSQRSPTVSHLASPEWVAVETVIDEATVRNIIPRLKSLGAEGIVEYPLNKVVH